MRRFPQGAAQICAADVKSIIALGKVQDSAILRIAELLITHSRRGTDRVCDSGVDAPGIKIALPHSDNHGTRFVVIDALMWTVVEGRSDNWSGLVNGEGLAFFLSAGILAAVGGGNRQENVVVVLSVRKGFGHRGDQILIHGGHNPAVCKSGAKLNASISNLCNDPVSGGFLGLLAALEPF